MAEDKEKKDQKQSRREFLVKSGKYAAYASPVILTFLAPRAGIYAQSGSGSGMMS